MGLPKSLEIIVGVIAGAVVWFILSMIFGIFPVIGWILDLFVAPVVAGYVAGRFGGIWAAVILALACPVFVWVVGSLLIGMILGWIAFLGPLLGQWVSMAFNIIVGIWALFNLMFVGVGGWMGNAARAPKRVVVEMAGGPVQASRPPGYSQSVSQAHVSNERMLTEDDSLIKKRILGYILSHRRVELKTLVVRYNLNMEEVEDIIFEHLADGKIRGSINSNGTFTLVD